MKQDNVVHLRPNNKEDIIKIAKTILAEAQRGDIKALAFAVIKDNLTETCYNIQTYGEGETIIGALEILKHRVLVKLEDL